VKIEILDEAREDLMEGFRFYESLDEGLGSYFLDCLFSDIDSLVQFFGIQLSHRPTVSVGLTRLGFLTQAANRK